MSDERQIEIKFSKRKLTLMLFGSIIFVGLGIWFVLNPTKFVSSIYQNTTVIFIAGLAGILFFGFAGIFILKKLGDKKPGLIINDKGIIDNSSAVATGQILWSDISTIEVAEIYKQKFLMLIVDNPEFYISRQTKAVKRKAMQINFKSFGSPISIAANGLQYNFEELKNILDKKFEEFKTNRQVV